jgi:hypothetical protein
LIYTNQLLEEYFKAFNQKYSDYNIDKRQLEILDMNKKKNYKEVIKIGRIIF